MIPRLDRIESMDNDTEYETSCMAMDGDSGTENEWWKDRKAESWPSLNPQEIYALEGDRSSNALVLPS
jgi:hypothetical protein